MKCSLGVIRGGIFEPLPYARKLSTFPSGVIRLLQDIDRNTWATKKMLRYLFNKVPIGTPGVISDGRLGGRRMRKLLSYKEVESGQARRGEWEADAKRNYDFN